MKERLIGKCSETEMTIEIKNQLDINIKYAAT